MEFNFSTGVIVGIVIAVIFINIVSSADEPKTTARKQTVSTYGTNYRNYYNDNNYDSYESYGLHERGMH